MDTQVGTRAYTGTDAAPGTAVGIQAETARSAAGRRPVALLLPGQGAQHVRMAAGLYDRDETFSTTMDVCLGCFADGRALRADWLAERPRIDIDDARRAQPLLLSVDYALGQLVRSWGIEPAALLGHSVGETAAAVLAGVLSFADAAALTDRRVRRARDTPPGGMLAVAAPVADVTPALVAGVVVGAVNAPRQTVLAGPEGPLRTVERRLRERGLLFRRVPSLTAFHSPAVQPAADPADLVGVRLRPPRLPVYSGYTAAELTGKEATDPRFWASHPVAPVLFWPALNRLLSTRPLVLIEAGPGQQLVSIARRHRSVASGQGAAWGLLPARPAGDAADLRALRETVERLHQEGYRDVPLAPAGHR